MFNLSHVIYVTPTMSQPIYDFQQSDQHPYRVYHVATLRELFTTLEQYSVPIHLIIIDVELLYDTDTVNPFDIINTLMTLVKYSKISNTNINIFNCHTTLAIAASLSTDIKKVKEALGISGIQGVCPCGSGITVDEVGAAIADLAIGKPHTPKKLHTLMCAKKKSSDNSPDALTQRQQQILNLVTTRGASNKAIANMLHITDSTVKLHMTAILKKCGVRSRTQLAIFARDVFNLANVA